MNSAKETPLSFETFHNTIDGLPRTSAENGNGTNPSDGKPLWDVPVATKQDLEDAVNAAKKAFKSWSKTKWEDRQQIIKNIAAELMKYEEELGKVVVLEGGKPIQFAKFDIGNASRGLQFYVTQPPFEEEVISDDADLRLTTRHVPMGVVGAICPWNFPLPITMNKVGPALLTGSTIIIKPSPFTPYSTLKFAEIANKFLPPGVLQALHGNDKLGPLMTEHPGIDMITFTGSTPTGKRIMASCAKTLKKVTLELGGNSAAIICPDVDVNKVAPKVALGAFFNSGQLCVASKRLYVHQDIYQDMLKALTDVVKSWKTAGASEEGVMLGPVQNEMQHAIVKSFFEDCASNGHEFALPGSVGQGPGFVVQPAIVDNPPESSRIVKEEQFGPIVPMMPWNDEDDVIARVNATNTGLGGAVYSADLDRARRLGARIEAGTVWINSNERPLPNAFFSGWKDSGVSGEGGRLGLYAYMNAQSTHLYKNDVGKST